MNHHPIQVLLVDDDDDLRGQLAAWLENKHGYAVETSADGTSKPD